MKETRGFREQAVVWLVCVLMLFSPAAAARGTESGLELPQAKRLAEESRHLAASLNPASDSSPRSQDAALLVKAADILRTTAQCRAGRTLLRQAALLGAARDTDFWISLARSCACAGEWKCASQASWLAMEQDVDGHRRKEIYTMLAQALYERSRYSDDWLSDVRVIYEALSRLDSNPALIHRLEVIAMVEREKQMLQVTGSTVRRESNPVLCLRFNGELDADLDYGRYVRVSPSVDGEFSVNSRELCLSGARYGVDYKIVVRQGMPGKKKSRRIPADQVLDVMTGHAPAAVWFEQNNYVLSVRSGPSVPLHTINVNRVRCRLYRIHERNLLSSFVRENFRRPLNRYDMETLGREVGTEVWQGSVAIKGEMDRQATGRLRLPERFLEAPGLYVLVAENADTSGPVWRGRASQWLVITDIGLTTYQGQDGMTVIARSLQDARPLSGIPLTLYARSNMPLAVQVTDHQGRARFAPGLFKGKGGRRAVQIVAADDRHGFVFLPLAQAPMDLSDRGVSGRPAPGPLDAYLFSEQGVYRPGDEVNLVALVRDGQGRPVPGMPLTLRLYDPMDRIKADRILNPDHSGAYVTRITLPGSSLTGRWSARLYTDPEARPVGTRKFQVAPIRPPRIEARLESRGSLVPGSPLEVRVKADYLYGAPGANLHVGGMVRFSYTPHPFAEYSDFWFGQAGKEPDLLPVQIEDRTTDQQGRARISLTLDRQVQQVRQPLSAHISVEVSDIDGRVVTARMEVPVRQMGRYLGVRPLFTGKSAPASSQARFQAVLLDRFGKTLDPGGIRYRLVREEESYQWFLKNDQWGYEKVIVDHLEHSGRLGTAGQGLVEFALPVGQGRYRLELMDRAGKERLTVYRFVAGNPVTGGGNRPDLVRLALDKKRYRAGEVARLTIVPPYPGEADLVLAGTGVEQVRSLTLAPEETTTVEIPVQKEWGSGIYLLVSAYHPVRSGGVERAVGLVWLDIDPVEYRLDVTISGPEEVRPGREITVPVRVTGSDAGKQVFLTLAAVDEAVLDLTGFQTPDPLAWFFGKKRLGVEIRDLYGRLIRSVQGPDLVARTGSGEDEAPGLRGSPKSGVRIVSLFSGPVRTDGQGRVGIPLELPGFTGRLRLMAVAWSGERLGSTSRDLLVRDPVVLSPSLPRFLARDDKAFVRVLLDNMAGPPGRYTLQWSGRGAVGVESAEKSLLLQQGERGVVDFPVTGKAIGQGEVDLVLQGPGGYRGGGTYPLHVRGRSLQRLTRTYRELAPNQVFRLDRSVVQELYPESARVLVNVSSSVAVDVPGLLEQLERYPYGCLEQLTSRALPLLYANELAQRYGTRLDGTLSERLAQAIDLILMKQKSTGAFGLWDGLGDDEPWLSAYAMDFLTRAREKGYWVPEFFFLRGLDWMERYLDRPLSPGRQTLSSRIYMTWVLARNGRLRSEDARYLFDSMRKKVASSLAMAQLAGTLALSGDMDRARSGFSLAMSTPDTGGTPDGYGSRLRDLAGLVAVLADVDLEGVDPAPVWQELARTLGQHEFLSTQEQAWLILAALTLEPGQPLSLEITQGQAVTTIGDQVRSHTLSLTGSELSAEAVEIRNLASAKVWITVTVTGDPLKDPPEKSSGFTVRRRLLTPGGTPVDPDQIRQGELIVVSVAGTAPSGEGRQALLVDLLPAGFEIEKEEVSTYGQFAWLAKETPLRYRNSRDDRMVISFATGTLPQEEAGERTFHYAWLVRAVTPGTYTMPSPEVEAMYRPDIRARGRAATVRILSSEGRARP